MPLLSRLSAKWKNWGPPAISSFSVWQWLILESPWTPASRLSPAFWGEWRHVNVLFNSRLVPIAIDRYVGRDEGAVPGAMRQLLLCQHFNTQCDWVDDVICRLKVNKSHSSVKLLRSIHQQRYYVCLLFSGELCPLLLNPCQVMQRGGGEMMRVIESLRFTSFHTIHHLINTWVKGRPIQLKFPILTLCMTHLLNCFHYLTTMSTCTVFLKVLAVWLRWLPDPRFPRFHSSSCQHPFCCCHRMGQISPVLHQ